MTFCVRPGRKPERWFSHGVAHLYSGSWIIDLMLVWFEHLVLTAYASGGML